MCESRKCEIKAKLYDLKVQADKLKEGYEATLAPMAKEFNTLAEELKRLDSDVKKEEGKDV